MITFLSHENRETCQNFVKNYLSCCSNWNSKIISEYKICEIMRFKWLPIFVRKKEKFFKILSKITPLVAQTEIQKS